MASSTEPTSTHGASLAGTVALVTGGARRVGRVVALRLAAAGMDVAITFRRSGAQAQDVVGEIRNLGRRAAAMEVDLARPDAAQTVRDRFGEHFDRLDALVNNASGFEPSPAGGVSVEAFDHNMAVNARAPLMLIQAFAPMLAAHHPDRVGRVVNFIDIHVLGQPLKGYVAYNASKAALKEVTMTAAMELAPKVTVNAIAPGVVCWAPSYTAEQRALYMKRVPLQRPGTPEDAAQAVLYLVRDAAYCTGQILKLDGGRLLT